MLVKYTEFTSEQFRKFSKSLVNTSDEKFLDAIERQQHYLIFKIENKTLIGITLWKTHPRNWIKDPHQCLLKDLLSEDYETSENVTKTRLKALQKIFLKDENRLPKEGDSVSGSEKSEGNIFSSSRNEAEFTAGRSCDTARVRISEVSARRAVAHISVRCGQVYCD